jgi:hypothetical protein
MLHVSKESTVVEAGFSRNLVIVGIGRGGVNRGGESSLVPETPVSTGFPENSDSR